jgi:predicted permease
LKDGRGGADPVQGGGAPRWARRLLARLARPPYADEVIGDLEEAHRDRVARRGRIVAWLLTGLDALDMAVALVRERRRTPVVRRTASGPVVEPEVRRMAVGLSWLDFKLGLRMLARYPGLTVIGGIAMAFGIAAGAGMFEFLKDAAFPTLPYAGAERLVRIHHTSREGPATSPSLQDWEMWRDELGSVSELGALHGVGRNLSVGSESAPVRGFAIDSVAFDLVQVRPLHGRRLQPADARPDAQPVALLSHALWRDRFAGDPDVVGRVVRLGDEQTTVVGVMPDGYDFPLAGDLWVPFRLNPLDYEPGKGPGVMVLGRLSSDASLATAQAELAALGVRMSESYPDTHGDLRPVIEPFPAPALHADGITVAGAFSFGTVFIAALMALMCTNIALLLFARAAIREGELAVRSALGASRARIVGQLFAEAVVLAAVSAVVGIAGATIGLRWVYRAFESQSQPLPSWMMNGLSFSTVVFAVVLAFVGAVVAGVLPGLRITDRRGQLNLARAAGRSGAQVGRIWSVITIGQVATTVVFVFITGVVGADTNAIRTVDPGFPAAEYLGAVLETDAREGFTSSSAALADAAFRAAYEERTIELKRRLLAEPGVRGATRARRLPGSWHERRPVELDGGIPPERWGSRAQYTYVDPDYFAVIGAAVVAGRTFDEGDVSSDSRVVVVNESFVREFLGGRNAIGQLLRYPDPAAMSVTRGIGAPAGEWYRVVGVVRDIVLSTDPDLPHHAGIYHPLRASDAYPIHIAVHVAGDAAAFSSPLRHAAAEVDPSLRVLSPITLDQASRDALIAYESWLRAIIIAAAIALLLTNAGIYAILSYTVSRRTREIGVRVALGADARQIVSAIVRRTARQVGIGVLIGVAFIATMSTGATFRGLGLRDVALLAAHALVMTAVCMLACVVPARRALRIEPTEALSSDG